MRLWTLGSGSKGNAVLIECGDTRVLVDAGFSPSEIARRLRPTGVAPESIEAVIVTHEHSDHVRGVAAAARRWGWTIHATAGTAADPSLADATVQRFTAGDSIAIGELELETVATSHDAVEPVALVATARCSGARAGIGYDMGTVNAAVRRAFVRLDLLVLEANHDDDMLRHGPYPLFLQRRIASSTGHLSNDASAAMAQSCVHKGLQEIVLAHLSEKCNSPQVALRTVGDALVPTRFRGRLSAARQDAPLGPFTVRASSAPPSTQLSLSL
jgi:phosphoribosyl 1,2-cyclic phosphodiesterase